MGHLHRFPSPPSLVALDPKYFAAAMEAYKGGQRKNDIMKSLASGVSGADLGSLALYFGLQKPARAQTPAPGDPAAAVNFIRATHMGLAETPRGLAWWRQFFSRDAHLWMWDYPALEVELDLSEEIAVAWWTPFEDLAWVSAEVPEAPTRVSAYRLPHPEAQDVVLWGITYRLLDRLFRVTETTSPAE